MKMDFNDIFQDVNNAFQAYITELRGIQELAPLFKKTCLDMAIAHIPNIYSGFSYQDTYFYDIERTSNLDELQKALSDSFDTSWWEHYATYLFAQAICSLPDMHPRFIDVNALKTLVNSYITALCNVFYRYVQIFYVQNYFRNEYQSLLVDTKSYREQYCSILKSHIAIHELWYTYGEWEHPELEIYFHIIKLLALGMNQNEINALLQELKSMGLVIPDTLMSDRWKTNMRYMFGKELITYDDLLKCFSAKVKSNAQAEPLIRYVMAIAPTINA